MAIREIKLSNQDTITTIDCGSTSPKFGGELFLANLINLKTLVCPGNNITKINDYESNVNLETLNINDNLLSGSIPNLSNMASLKFIRCYNNNFSGGAANFLTAPIIQIINYGNNKIDGPIPNFSGRTTLTRYICYQNNHSGQIPNLNSLPNIEVLSFYQNPSLTGSIPQQLNLFTKLKEFYCYENNHTGGIGSLTGLTSLQFFLCYRNNMSGEIPSLTGLISLQEFLCYQNYFSGEIPSLTGLTNLKKFSCYNNQLTGAIPNLSTLTSLQLFHCGGNGLTSFAGGSIPATLKDIQIHNNQLSSEDIDAILAALVANGSTGGVIYLGGSNENPTTAGNTSITTLTNRGWTIGETPPTPNS